MKEKFIIYLLTGSTNKSNSCSISEIVPTVEELDLKRDHCLRIILDTPLNKDELHGLFSKLEKVFEEVHNVTILNPIMTLPCPAPLQDFTRNFAETDIVYYLEDSTGKIKQGRYFFEYN